MEQDVEDDGQLPPLGALTAFEAVARLGSVSAAATALGRTHGAISKRITQLEAWVGRPLFERTPSGLDPRPQTAALAATVRHALADIEAGFRDARGAAEREPILVNCSATLAARWFLPRLEGFHRAYPELDVRLSFADVQTTLPRSLARTSRVEIDMLVSFDRLDAAPEFHAQRLGAGAAIIPIGDAELGPVVSPRAAPGMSTIVPYAASNAWARWREVVGETAKEFITGERYVIPNLSVAIAAAASGEGATLVERRLVERELVEGTLVAPFGFIRFPDGFVALVRRGSEARTRPLVSYLRRHAGTLAGSEVSDPE